ncbi:MAG: YkgJ family cysteine cluster protein [Myxococcota bacterium]
MSPPDATPRTRLKILYQRVDDAVAAYVQGFPPARCDEGCADCCRSRPPLVSREEAALVMEELGRLPEEMHAEIRRRAREIAVRLAGGDEPEFACPLLVEDGGIPRCSVYAARPYACRTFGQTSRISEGETQPKPFTCGRLVARVGRCVPPPVPFRSEALRQMVGVERLTDSYLPIWVGLDPDEQREAESGPASSVVVPEHGVRG